MNKLLKLPLFLGVVGCLCGGVLAVTNHFTAPVIQEAEKARENAAYVKHFANLDEKKEQSLTESLTKGGVDAKYYAYDATGAYIGSVYKCSVKGYVDTISFTISFKNGVANHYEEIAQKETVNGKTFMEWLKGDTNGNRLGNLEEGKTLSGSTTTYNAVSKVVGLCFADYTAEYSDIPALVK